jgi:glucose-6-phosphate 1-dehydrogenase
MCSQNGLDEAAWAGFLERIEYVKLDLGKAEDFALLRDAVQ